MCLEYNWIKEPGKSQIFPWLTINIKKKKKAERDDTELEWTSNFKIILLQETVKYSSIYKHIKTYFKSSWNVYAFFMLEKNQDVFQLWWLKRLLKPPFNFVT